MVRRRRLAAELRRLREAAGLTSEEVAARLECSASKISRIETGRVSVSPRDVRDLLEIYGARADQRDSLMQLAREARQRGWWQGYANSVEPHLVTYLSLEADTSEIRVYSASRVPILLQTGDYARALSIATRSGTTYPGTPDRAAEMLLERQRIAAASPPAVLAVVDEAALLRRVGGPDVPDRAPHRCQFLQVLGPAVHPAQLWRPPGDDHAVRDPWLPRSGRPGYRRHRLPDRRPVDRGHGRSRPVQPDLPAAAGRCHVARRLGRADELGTAKAAVAPSRHRTAAARCSGGSSGWLIADGRSGLMTARAWMTADARLRVTSAHGRSARAAGYLGALDVARVVPGGRSTAVGSARNSQMPRSARTTADAWQP